MSPLQLSRELSEAEEEIILMFVMSSRFDISREAAPIVEDIANTTNLIVLKIDRGILDLFQQIHSDWKFLYEVKYVSTFIIVRRRKIVEAFIGIDKLRETVSKYVVKTSDHNSTATKPESKVINIESSADLKQKESEAGDKLVLIFVMKSSDNYSSKAVPIVEEVANTMENVVVLKIDWSLLDLFYQNVPDWKHNVYNVKYLPTFILVRKKKMIDVFVDAEKLHSYMSKYAGKPESKIANIDSAVDLTEKLSEAEDKLVLIVVMRGSDNKSLEAISTVVEDIANSVRDFVVLKIDRDLLDLFEQNLSEWRYNVIKMKYLPTFILVRRHLVIDVIPVYSTTKGLLSDVSGYRALFSKPYKPESKVINIDTPDDLTRNVVEAGDKLVVIFVCRSRLRAKTASFIDDIANEMNDVIVLKVNLYNLAMLEQYYSDWNYGVSKVLKQSFIFLRNGKIVDVVNENQKDYFHSAVQMVSSPTRNTTAVKPESSLINIETAQDLATRVSEAGDKLVVIYVIIRRTAKDSLQAFPDMELIAKYLPVIVLTVNRAVLDLLDQNATDWKYGVFQVSNRFNSAFILVKNGVVIDAYMYFVNQENKLIHVVLNHGTPLEPGTMKSVYNITNIESADDLATKMAEAGDKLVVLFVSLSWSEDSLSLGALEDIAKNATSNVVVLKIMWNNLFLYEQNDTSTYPNANLWNEIYKSEKFPSYKFVKNGNVIDVEYQININNLASTVSKYGAPSYKPLIDIRTADGLSSKTRAAGDKLVLIFVRTSRCSISARVAFTVEDIAQTMDNVVVLKIVWDKLDPLEQISSDWQYGVSDVKLVPRLILVKNGNQVAIVDRYNIMALRNIVARYAL